PRITVLYRKLSRLDLIFIAALLLYWLLALGPTGAPDLLRLAVYALGVAVTIRLARIASRRILLRLRNRLLVAYLFIAVVPIMLILILVGISTFVLSGQMAAHLVSSELDRRIAALRGPAQFLARTSPSARADVLKRMSSYIQQNFSDFEVAIADRDI